MGSASTTDFAGSEDQQKSEAQARAERELNASLPPQEAELPKPSPMVTRGRTARQIKKGLFQISLAARIKDFRDALRATSISEAAPPSNIPSGRKDYATRSYGEGSADYSVHNVMLAMTAREILYPGAVGQRKVRKPTKRSEKLVVIDSKTTIEGETYFHPETYDLRTREIAAKWVYVWDTHAKAMLLEIYYSSEGYAYFRHLPVLGSEAHLVPPASERVGNYTEWPASEPIPLHDLASLPSGGITVEQFPPERYLGFLSPWQLTQAALDKLPFAGGASDGESFEDVFAPLELGPDGAYRALLIDPAAWAESCRDLWVSPAWNAWEAWHTAEPLQSELLIAGTLNAWRVAGRNIDGRLRGERDTGILTHAALVKVGQSTGPAPANALDGRLKQIGAAYHALLKAREEAVAYLIATCLHCPEHRLIQDAIGSSETETSDLDALEAYLLHIAVCTDLLYTTAEGAPWFEYEIHVRKGMIARLADYRKELSPHLKTVNKALSALRSIHEDLFTAMALPVIAQVKSTFSLAPGLLSGSIGAGGGYRLLDKMAERWIEVVINQRASQDLSFLSPSQLSPLDLTLRNNSSMGAKYSQNVWDFANKDIKGIVPPFSRSMASAQKWIGWAMMLDTIVLERLLGKDENGSGSASASGAGSERGWSDAQLSLAKGTIGVMNAVLGSINRETFLALQKAATKYEKWLPPGTATNLRKPFVRKIAGALIDAAKVVKAKPADMVGVIALGESALHRPEVWGMSATEIAELQQVRALGFSGKGGAVAGRMALGRALTLASAAIDVYQGWDHSKFRSAWSRGYVGRAAGQELTFWGGMITLLGGGILAAAWLAGFTAFSAFVGWWVIPLAGALIALGGGVGALGALLKDYYSRSAFEEFAELSMFGNYSGRDVKPGWAGNMLLNRASDIATNVERLSVFLSNYHVRVTEGAGLSFEFGTVMPDTIEIMIGIIEGQSSYQPTLRDKLGGTPYPIPRRVEWPETADAVAAAKIYRFAARITLATGIVEVMPPVSRWYPYELRFPGHPIFGAGTPSISLTEAQTAEMTSKAMTSLGVHMRDPAWLSRLLEISIADARFAGWQWIYPADHRPVFTPPPRASEAPPAPYPDPYAHRAVDSDVIVSGDNLYSAFGAGRVLWRLTAKERVPWNGLYYERDLRTQLGAKPLWTAEAIPLPASDLPLWARPGFPTWRTTG